MRTDPMSPIRNGLYVQSLFSLYRHHTEYVSNRQHRGIKIVEMLVTVTPKAAKLEAIVFE